MRFNCVLIGCLIFSGIVFSSQKPALPVDKTGSAKHAETIDRLKEEYDRASPENRKTVLAQIVTAVDEMETILKQEYKEKKVKPPDAGKRLERALYTLSVAYRDLGDMSAATRTIDRALLLSKGTAIEVERRIYKAFFSMKTDPKITIRELESIRETPGFLKQTVSRSWAEKEVLRQLAWLYSNSGQNQKALTAYEQYFQWIADQNASINALELQNWKKYKDLTAKAKPGLSEKQRSEMEAKLRKIPSQTIEREAFSLKILAGEAEDEQTIGKQFQAIISGS